MSNTGEEGKVQQLRGVVGRKDAGRRNLPYTEFLLQIESAAAFGKSLETEISNHI